MTDLRLRRTASQKDRGHVSEKKKRHKESDDRFNKLVCSGLWLLVFNSPMKLTQHKLNDMQKNLEVKPSLFVVGVYFL